MGTRRLAGREKVTYHLEDICTNIFVFLATGAAINAPILPKSAPPIDPVVLKLKVVHFCVY